MLRKVTLCVYAFQLPPNSPKIPLINMEMETFWKHRAFWEVGSSSNPLKIWHARQDSNLRPLAPEANALSS